MKAPLGTLIYGRTQEYDFDDRALEPLRVVITTRVSKGASFLCTWTTPPPGAGTISIWVSPAIPISFRFAGEQREALSREWLQQLMRSSWTPRGLVLTPEPSGRGRSASGSDRTAPQAPPSRGR